LYFFTENGTNKLPEAIGTNKLPERQIIGSSYNYCDLTQAFGTIGRKPLPQDLQNAALFDISKLPAK